MNAAEQRYFALGQPRPAAELVSFLNSLRPNTKGYVRVWRNDTAYQIDGRDLPDPPPSLAMILKPDTGGHLRDAAHVNYCRDDFRGR